MKINAIHCYQKRKADATPLECAFLETGLGLKGDAYADGGERQLVLMDTSALKQDPKGEPRGFCREKFKANIIIEKFGENELQVGMLLIIGKAKIRLTGIKGCYELCERLTQKLSCPLKGAAAFGVVEEGGIIKIGDEVIISD